MAYIPGTPFAPSKLISAATTNSTSVTTVPTIVGVLSMGNNGSSIVYVKAYDKASAPTVGTDVPKHTYLIPANLSGAGSNITINGLHFLLGFAIAITGGIADADTTAVLAGQAVVNWGTAPA